ncbi:hypothetical protein HN615_14960 [Candidatus Woesearchaeota archaeon]|jgi:hypothetical protein|nr:hypothetical protein [Candidatus Woesearchaeota archaeon]
MKTKEMLEWKEFDKLENTDDVIIKKAKGLAPVFIYIVPNIIDAFEHSLKEGHMGDKKLLEKYKEKELEISMQFLMLLFHWTDRMSFALLKNEKRNIFINTLLAETKGLYSKAIEGGIEIELFRDTFNKNYDDFQDKYGKFKLYAEKEEGLGGTVLWEFGKDIMDLLDNQHNLMLMMLFPQLFTFYFKQLNISGLLTSK